MLIETAAAKLVGLATGVLLVLAGSLEVGSAALEAVGVQAADAASITAALERIAPNFVLGAMGMFLIYKIATVQIREATERQTEAITHLADRIGDALADTVNAHKLSAAESSEWIRTELRGIETQLRRIKPESG